MFLRPAITEFRLLATAGQNFAQKCYVHHHMERRNLELFLGIKRSNKNRANRNTHKNEKRFRKARAAKVLIMDLPEDSEFRERQNMEPDELRLSFLRKGINPFKDVSPRTWNEHETTLQSFYGVIDPYIKPKYVINTDKNPPVSTKSITEKTKEFGLHHYHNYLGTRRIKKKEGLKDFSDKTLIPELENKYVNAHLALTNRNKDELHELITEHAFSKMWPDVENGSVKWELVRFLEPTQIVSVRAADNPNKSGNDIAQVIARIHSMQKLAIYDRFGKLLLGSETEEKDSLEFVVFEMHISSFSGRWRLHDKVYPSGIPPKAGPIDSKIIESLPVDEERRPTASKPLKLRISERIKEDLDNPKEKDA